MAASSSSPMQNNFQPTASAASSSYSHHNTVNSAEALENQSGLPLIAASAGPASVAFPADEGSCSASNAPVTNETNVGLQATPTSAHKSCPDKSLCGYIKESVCRRANAKNKTPTTARFIEECIENIRRAAEAMRIADADLEKISEHISNLLEIFEKKKESGNTSKPNDKPFTSSNFSKFKEGISVLLINVWKEVPHTDTNKVITDLLHGMGTAHLATTSLLVVAIILERCETMKTNRNKCLSLLRDMDILAKYVKEVKQRPELKRRMQDSIKKATELTVEASLYCCHLLNSSKACMFLSAIANQKGVGELQGRLQKWATIMKRKMDIIQYDQMQEIKRKTQEQDWNREIEKLKGQPKEEDFKSEKQDLKRNHHYANDNMTTPILFIIVVIYIIIILGGY